MTIGTILGLLQRNLRRILAYSSISHSGYILAGIAVAPKLDLTTGIDGIGASFFYLIAYFLQQLNLCLITRCRYKFLLAWE